MKQCVVFYYDEVNVVLQKVTWSNLNSTSSISSHPANSTNATPFIKSFPTQADRCPYGITGTKVVHAITAFTSHWYVIVITKTSFLCESMLQDKIKNVSHDFFVI